MQAKLEKFSDNISSMLKRAQEPRYLPYTVTVGTVAGVVAGITAYRFFTAPHEAKLSDDQSHFDKGVDAASEGGKAITVKRVARDSSAMDAAGAVLGASFADNDLIQRCATDVRIACNRCYLA